MFRIKCTFLLFAIIFLCLPARGMASPTSDSLRQLIARTGDKTVKADALASLAREIMSSHADSAFIVARQSKDLSASIGYLAGISRAANILGLLFLEIGDETKAMEYFLLSLRICEQTKDKPGLSRCYNNIGLILSNQNMDAKALSYYLKSLQMEEELKNNLGIAQSLNNIGLHFCETGDYKQAISYSLRSLELYKQIGSKTGLAEILNNLGIIYNNKKEYSKALDYYYQSLRIEEENQNNLGIAKSAYNIAGIYQSLGNLTESNRLNERALKLAQGLSNREMVSECAVLKSQNLKKAGDFKAALKYLELSRSINDSLANAGMDQKIQELEQAYEIEKQQSQIVLLEKDNIIQQKLAERQTLQRNLMMGGILVIALFAFFHLRSSRRNKKINELLAQRNLEILKQQEALADSNEEISRQRDALKKSNADKDKFFSIVAHDLKSPFTSMLGFSEILAEEYKTLSDSERQEIAADIHSSIKTGFNLVENLLAWGSLQIGRIEFAPNQLKLKQEVDEVLKLLQRIALLKKIGIYNEVEPGVIVEADANMLHSVLRNLVSNALKYTHNGGKIRISASASDIPGMIRISVSDSGIGINKDDLAKLFSPKISFSTRGTANETGTGLGLLLCSEMISKHGGQIGVQSDPGNGSTFYFTIPALHKHEINNKSIH
jgi:signal transduction histidine kinase